MLEQAKAIRAARSGSRWSRPFGVLCLGLAAWAVLDPEYPMPSPVPTASSADQRPELAPAKLFPAGAIGALPLRFTWSSPPGSERTEFVLADEGFDEVYRGLAQDGSFDATDAVVAQLRSGRQFHWRVESVRGGVRRSSASIAVCFSGETIPDVTVPTVPQSGVTQLRK